MNSLAITIPAQPPFPAPARRPLELGSVLCDRWRSTSHLRTSAAPQPRANGISSRSLIGARALGIMAMMEAEREWELMMGRSRGDEGARPDMAVCIATL
ncbi:hypothetical protein CMUS01_08062 [Colletotrichum musicola]|uniref:Uncharacterized protein n=1 Tax=Colletotrichum musicola TaxID=2175873 RepID=A0A8H6KFA6_9PEZI|nr:hypothetical protein CMUS01_08062 [Colletotrichum musicola]